MVGASARASRKKLFFSWLAVLIFPWKGVSARASRKKFFFSKLAVLIFLWKGVSARASRKKQFGSSSEAIGKQFGSSSEAVRKQVGLRWWRLAWVVACAGGGLRGWWL